MLISALTAKILISSFIFLYFTGFVTIYVILTGLCKEKFLAHENKKHGTNHTKLTTKQDLVLFGIAVGFPFIGAIFTLLLIIQGLKSLTLSIEKYLRK